MYLNKQEKELLKEIGPSEFLFHVLNPNIACYTFVKVTQDLHPEYPHLGIRIVPNTKVGLETNIMNSRNSFQEFFLNRVLAYLHYFMDRGTVYEPVKKVVLIVVYFDYMIKYVIDLEALDMESPINLSDFSEKAIESIKQMGKVLTPTSEITGICFNKPTYNREHILEEIQNAK